MKLFFQIFFLLFAVLFFTFLAQIRSSLEVYENAASEPEKTQSEIAKTPSNLSYQSASVLGAGVPVIPAAPKRKEGSAEPAVQAEAVLVESLDDRFPFYHLNTYELWPMASLTKLLTAIVVIENIGLDKKILVSHSAVLTEGAAGDLAQGEEYTALDLVKIMLLTSSNDAAAAFEEYVGGKEIFAEAIRQKMQKIGMLRSEVYDGSGLADENRTTATDLRRLTRYIQENHPEIFEWTRLTEANVSPLNEPIVKTALNINPFAGRANFLGGKTGTSEAARENFLGVFAVHGRRVAVVVLGSPNRAETVDRLLTWIEEAYEF